MNLKPMCFARTKGGCPKPPLPGEQFCADHIDENLAKAAAFDVFDVSGLCTAKISPPCDRPVFAKGYCEGHLKKKTRGKKVDVPLRGYQKKQGDAAVTEMLRVMTRVSKKAGRIFKRRMKAEKLSNYELARRIIESWADRESEAA